MWDKAKQAAAQKRWRDNHPEYAKQWWQSEDGRIKRRIYTQRQRLEHHEEWLARAALNRAVRRGKLQRKPCQICGDVKVEGHHFAGYERENHLTVHWLCHSHHREAHGK